MEAVYIAVPHHLLAPLTQKVLEADKHALTEKPLAISLEEVDQLITAGNRTGISPGRFLRNALCTGHALARELIQAGAIGNIVGVQIQTLIDKPLSYWQSGYSGRSINPWRGLKAQAGGGVVLMNTSHLLDALFYMTGLTVTSVSAEIGTLVASVEVEDMATATLRFNNGAIGSLIAGAHIPGAHDEEYCSIYGTQGQIRLPDPYGSDPMRIYLKRAWRDFSSRTMALHPYKTGTGLSAGRGGFCSSGAVRAVRSHRCTARRGKCWPLYWQSINPRPSTERLLFPEER